MGVRVESVNYQEDLSAWEVVVDIAGDLDRLVVAGEYVTAMRGKSVITIKGDLATIARAAVLEEFAGLRLAALDPARFVGTVVEVRRALGGPERPVRPRSWLASLRDGKRPVRAKGAAPASLLALSCRIEQLQVVRDVLLRAEVEA